MKRSMPLLLVALVAAGAGIGQKRVQSLEAQEAMCSVGTDQQCEEQEVCTRWGWTISLRQLSFGWTCQTRTTKWLYFRQGLGTGGSSPGSEDNDPPGDLDDEDPNNPT